MMLELSVTRRSVVCRSIGRCAGAVKNDKLIIFSMLIQMCFHVVDSPSMHELDEPRQATIRFVIVISL
jgi:hypothetical protein